MVATIWWRWAEKALIAAVVLSALAPGRAVATEAEARSGIEEIVVRARKRDERLLDTPVSVTALKRSDLSQVGAARIDDIQRLVPNLQFRDSAIAQSQSIFLRGIGQADEGLAFDQGVGLNIDGVPLSRSVGLLLNLIDVEQIEILRGPQGTLFGRNTVGGVINVRTAKPGDEVAGSVFVRAGNLELVETRATLDIPIDLGWFEDRLFSRFAFASSNSRGYVRNLEDGEYFGDLNDLGFLGSLRFVPTDELTVDVSGSYERSHRRGVGGQCSFESGAVPNPQAMALARAFYPGFEESCEAQTPFGVRADAKSIADLESYGTWMNAAYEVGDVGFVEDLTLYSTTSWREQRPRYIVDTDFQEFPIIVSAHFGGPDPLGTDGEPAFARQISQEVRLHGVAIEDRLNVTAGAFFYWDDAEDTNGQSAFRFQTDGSSTGVGQGTSVATFEVDNYSWALFTQASFDITEWMQLTAGLRFTADQKGLSKREDFPLLADPVRVDARERSTFEDWTPMASLSLTLPDAIAPEIVDHAMVYFTYASGFKSGGFNALIGSQVPEGEVATTLDRFDPERVDSFEVGAKTTWFDDRLVAKLALFHADYRDMQVVETHSDGLSFMRFVTNAAESTIEGFEFEAEARPWSALTVTGSFGFLDAKFDEFPNAENNLALESIDRAGESLPNVPGVQTHLSIEYVAEVVSDGPLAGDVVPRLDWSYQSAVHYAGPEVRSLNQSGYHLFDVRLGYELWDESVSVAAWCRNLLDETYFTGGISFANLYGTTARFSAPPRTYGGEISFRF